MTSIAQPSFAPKWAKMYLLNYKLVQGLWNKDSGPMVYEMIVHLYRANSHGHYEAEIYNMFQDHGRCVLAVASTNLWGVASVISWKTFGSMLSSSFNSLSITSDRWCTAVLCVVTPWVRLWSLTAKRVQPRSRTGARKSHAVCHLSSVTECLPNATSRVP